MRYKDVIENNKADLNNLLIFDVYTPEQIYEFVKRNNMEDRIKWEQILQKLWLIDHHLQHMKANHADEDLKKTLQMVFGAK